jgi:hypothetical protein
MRNQTVFSGLALIMLVISSCSPKYYVPNTHNVPLLEEKGQINLAVHGNGNQFEIQGAAALSSNIGLMLNGGFFFPAEDDNGNGGSGRLGEVGLGYYTKIGEYVVFETYGLLGFGSVENNFPSTLPNNPSTTGIINANIFRAGIQPNIGYTSKYFSAAVSARFVSLNYSNIEGSLIFDGVDQFTYLENHKSSFLVEPALTVRAGIENIKLQAQLSGSWNLSHNNFPQENALLSLGLFVKI